jgi:hypothetical protein
MTVQVLINCAKKRDFQFIFALNYITDIIHNSSPMRQLGRRNEEGYIDLEDHRHARQRTYHVSIAHLRLFA